MSRSDSYIGLPEEARLFLGAQARKLLPPIKIGTFEGMFGCEYPLHSYNLQNGHYAAEFLQASPWASGPCFFIGLRLDTGEEYLWTEEEINEYVG